MRYLKTLLFLCLIGNSAIAQKPQPFPDSNAIWINAKYDLIFRNGVPLPQKRLQNTSKYCVYGQDTLINAMKYSQIFYCDSTYKGALREANRTVYFIPQDSLQEYVLYNFNAEAGDTLSNIYMENHGSIWPEIVVSQVDSFRLNNEYRKMIYVEEAAWIEGVGCTQGLFIHPFGNISNMVLELHCMSINDTSLYPQFSPAPCDKSFTIPEFKNQNPALQLFPNPVAEKLFFTISGGEKITQIKIISSEGKVVYQTNHRAYFIDVSALAKGIYLAEISTNLAKFYEKFMKFEQ